MAVGTHVFQAPKGTRDFYPDDMAVRRYIESAWREVSTNHGFDEIDGPTFEHLDLYKVKSGNEIESQLFSFRRHDGDTDYALRPEFTPTLARMAASKASSLAKPTKWFCTPIFFRAERPQRGRLREFVQWNADVIGDDSPQADAEIIAVSVGLLERLGLSAKHITIKISHRELVADELVNSGVSKGDVEAAMQLLDRRDKLPEGDFLRECAALGLDYERFQTVMGRVGDMVNDAIKTREDGGEPATVDDPGPVAQQLLQLIDELDALGVLRWCEFDPIIVRGLAYYTGTVFEIHEAIGKERAIAGGGRYDNLIELFGGSPTPAVGIAMGDVVLRLVLEDHGLLESAAQYMPRPHAFVISSGDDVAEAKLKPIVASLRRHGLHVRHSYRATRNVGKLLGEAAKTRAHYAVILGEELNDDRVVVKHLESGEQQDLALDQLASFLTQSNQR